MVDLRQLEHFVAVAQERHFTRAAAKLHIVQSGLSASIRALEEEMGATLFLRTTRRVNLTPAGAAFLSEAQRVLGAVAAARNAVAEVQGLKRGRLLVGAIQGLAPFIDLPRLLGAFRREHPQVEIQLRFDDTAALIEGVLDGRLDIAFTQFVEAPPPELAARMLACDPLVLACPGNHRLAGQRDLSLTAIAGEAFIDLPPAHGTRQLVNQSFAAAHLTRRSDFEVNDLTMQLDMVAHGLGVALVPELVVQGRMRAAPQAPISFATLAEPEPCWELAVVYGRHADTGRAGSAAAEACLRLLGDHEPV